MDGGTPRVGADVDPVPAPLALYSTAVPDEWVDYNGHMSEWCYLLVMGDSADAFFRYVGIDEDYRAAGASLYTAETHIRNILEVSRDERLSLTLQVLGADDKRVHIAHRLLRGDGEEVATGEQLLLHVDTREGRVRPFPAQLRRRVHRVACAHAELPVPRWVGRVMGLPSPTAASGNARGGGGTWTSS